MSALKDELANDPLGRDYASMSDEELVADLNTPRIPRNRTSMSGREVAAEIDNGEYDALRDVQKSHVLALIGSDNLDPFGLAANVIKDIFTTGSATLSNLAAVRVEMISRTTEIGAGQVSLKTLKLQSIR